MRQIYAASGGTTERVSATTLGPLVEKTVRRFREDLGHRAELEAFFNAICKGSDSPFPLIEIFSASKASRLMKLLSCWIGLTIISKPTGKSAKALTF